MDSTKIEELRKQGKWPEKSEYDIARFDNMRLRRNGLYGIPKSFLNSTLMMPGTCEKCVFNRGVHTCENS